MTNYSTSDPESVLADFDNVLELPRDRVRSAQALKHWLMTRARFLTETNEIVDGVATGLRKAGVPLDRMTTAIALLHSERAGVARVWANGEGAREVIFPYRPDSSSGFFNSPFHESHTTQQWVRFRPPETPDDRFSIVSELKEAGLTDYVCVPVLLSNGMENGFTFGTRNPAGFSAADLSLIGWAMPELATLMELLAYRRMLQEVTRIYVGREPQERILSGDVRRGEVMTIRSAIAFADMRDFTTHSMSLDPGAVVALLNRYYDCVVPQVEAEGGEVLKFIGDGILAIFRSDEVGEAEAVQCAIRPSRKALAAVEDAGSEETEHRRFRVGIGVHLGEAAYGNVGSGERLDYTVVGRDVNIAARIAGLCADLDAPLLISERCATLAAATDMVDAGSHALKGVEEHSRVFKVSG